MLKLVRYAFVAIFLMSLTACASNKYSKSARKRYHVKRGCGCTSYLPIEKKLDEYVLG